jgi:hypothetical protein
MRPRGLILLPALAAGVLLAAPAAAETIYKYRRPGGKTEYSNRLIPGRELIETFEYKFAEPAPPSPGAAKGAADADARIKKHLDALQAAWTEVQEATRALAEAEKRLRSNVEPLAGEREGVASGTAPAAAGGVPAAAPPAVGGAQSGRRGRQSPEYVARIQALEGALQAARERLDTALRRYNDLR